MKLNLGCGLRVIEGFTNVDVERGDVHHDLRAIPWPFTSNECSWINASHILEHFDKLDAYAFLRECHRILERGGLLTLAVPDMDKFITAHLSGDYTPLGEYPLRDMNTLMGGGKDEPDERNRHRYMYCYETLAYMLDACGFDGIHYRAGEALIDNPQYAAISLYMEARKCMTS